MSLSPFLDALGADGGRLPGTSPGASMAVNVTFLTEAGGSAP
jgi:hypothetical protein